MMELGCFGVKFEGAWGCTIAQLKGPKYQDIMELMGAPV